MNRSRREGTRARRKGPFDQILDWIGVASAKGRTITYDKVKRLRKNEVDRLLILCDEALADRAITEDPDKRIDLILLLWDFLPRSSPVFLSALGRFDSPSAYDVHFTMFGFISMFDEVSWRTRARWLENYLLSVPRGVGMAAWNAGDELGSRCPLRHALPSLLRTARSAEFAAGRTEALHGLAHALARLEEAGSSTRSALQVIRDVADQDRSPKVRTYAREILAGDRCTASPPSAGSRTNIGTGRRH
jgi:hypothetical protein